MNKISLALVLIAAALVWAPPLSADEQTPEKQEFLAAAKAETQKEEYQTALPAPPPENVEAPDFSIPPWVWKLLRVLFWIAAGIAVLFFGYLLYRFFEDRKLGPGPKDTSRDRPVRVVRNPGEVVHIPTLEEVDALAAKGDFSEAIHCLLLVALNAVFNRLQATLPKSHTSREILSDARLMETWRKDLSTLVGAVEEALFAGKAPGKKNYETCRSTYDSLAGSLKENG